VKIQKITTLIFIFLMLNGNISYCQVTWGALGVGGTAFGHTKEIIKEHIIFNTDNQTEFSIQLFDESEDKIIFTWTIVGMRVKSTCYFKNEILYKIHEHYKPSQSSDLRPFDPLDVLIQVMEEAFYEEYREVEQIYSCDGDYSGNFKKGRIWHYKKPGQKIQLKYCRNGESIRSSKTKIELISEYSPN
jgi:hypothetical protein